MKIYNIKRNLKLPIRRTIRDRARKVMRVIRRGVERRERERNYRTYSSNARIFLASMKGITNP